MEMGRSFSWAWMSEVEPVPYIGFEILVVGETLCFCFFNLYDKYAPLISTALNIDEGMRPVRNYSNKYFKTIVFFFSK